MSLRRQAARALGDVLQDRLRLQEPPAIISAPPSEVAEYPRAAIWLERFARNFWQEDELQVDADGNLMIGGRASINLGAGAAMLDDKTHLSIIGTLVGSGRIWSGCRLPAKREDLEESIDLAFVQEPDAIGRISIEVKAPKIGRWQIPWKWYGAAFVTDSEWTNEFAFSERLWSWVRFDLELAMLAPRQDPLVKQFLLDVDADFAQPTNDDDHDDDADAVVDLDGGADTEHVTVDLTI